MRRVKIHVTRNWVLQPGFKRQTIQAVLEVTLDATGNVLDDRRHGSGSGNPCYDESVVRAVQKASPLPPPPESGEWTFVFSPAGRALMPLRSALALARARRGWRRRLAPLRGAGARTARRSSSPTRAPRRTAPRCCASRAATPDLAGRGRASCARRSRAGSSSRASSSRSTDAAFLERRTARASTPEPRVTCPNWRQIGADALLQGELEAAGRPRCAPRSACSTSSRGCRACCARPTASTPASGAGSARRSPTTWSAPSRACPASPTPRSPSSPTARGAKEIYVMDADGGNVRRATAHKTINTFPNWSPDGTTIVYTSYRDANRPQLFLLTRGTRSPGPHPARARRRAGLPRRLRPERRASSRWCATSTARRRSTRWARAAAA